MSSGNRRVCVCMIAGEHGWGAAGVPAEGDSAPPPLRGSVHRGPERRRPVEERQLPDPAEEQTCPQPGTHTQQMYTVTYIHTHTRTHLQVLIPPPPLPLLQVRFSSLLLLMEVASKLKENYMVLLPETIPFLAELMEGEDTHAHARKKAEKLQLLRGV